MLAYILLDPRFIHFRPAMPIMVAEDRYDGWLSSTIRKTVTNLIDSFTAANRLRAKRAVLESLDDTMLRDIGIERRQLDCVVYGMGRGKREIIPNNASIVPLERRPREAGALAQQLAYAA